MENDNAGLFGEFVDREIAAMEIFLTAKASKTAITLEEYIQTRILLGADEQTIEADLLKDLEEGGRIFGEFRNAVRATSNGVINRTRDNAIFANLGVDAPYRWVAVLINTCPDCLERHNRVQPWISWEKEGLPRTGHTVCKENCKCILIPADSTEVEPIMRSKK
jgi:hypothetical protein